MALEARAGLRTAHAYKHANAHANTPAPNENKQQTAADNEQAAPTVHGCNLAGFVLVKKVPGTLHFAARAEGHSFDHAWLNATHLVHQFYFGSRPSPRKL